MIRVDLLDPPAYSPPYDHALARALAVAGASVRVVTSDFAHGVVPAPDGYRVELRFYRRAVGAPGSRLRQATKLAEHVGDMLAYRRSAQAGGADVCHYQWLTVPPLDLRLLPADVPTVLTIHDPLVRGGRHPGRPQPGPRSFAHVDAVVVHSQYAREQVITTHRLDPARVHVIRHGALGESAGPPAGLTGGLAGLAGGPAGERLADPVHLPPELDGAPPELPVVLCFGLIRPYKGLEAILAAWRGLGGEAELWVVGRPMMDISGLLAGAPAGVRFVPRFATEAETAAVFARADVVALPYERSERFGFSGVLARALGAGKAIVLSDIGGFAEVGALGAARTVPAGDVGALQGALRELLDDPGARVRLGDAAARAAREQFSWQAAARETLALYDRIRA